VRGRERLEPQENKAVRHSSAVARGVTSCLHFSAELVGSCVTLQQADFKRSGFS